MRFKDWAQTTHSYPQVCSYMNPPTKNIQLPFNQRMLTVRTSWRRLPPLLEILRDVPVDIRRAYIQPEQSTLFVNTNSPVITSDDLRRFMHRVENDPFVPPVSTPGKVELPMDSKILMYNVPQVPYTTMEFYCKDRIGLLSDLLQYMNQLDIDIYAAHITTMYDQAHNIFHLVKNDAPLEPYELLYIRNVFEHDVKPRFKDCNDLL